VQVFFKERVISSDARNLQLSSKPNASVVRYEGRVDVDEVDLFRSQVVERLDQSSPSHPPVLGVSRDSCGRNTHDCGIFFILLTLLAGRDENRLYIAVGEILAERPDGRGYAVNTREVDV
jgi:hypothetical protein